MSNQLQRRADAIAASAMAEALAEAKESAPDRAAHWLIRIGWKRDNNQPFLESDIRIGHQIMADLTGGDYATTSQIRNLIAEGKHAAINRGWIGADGYHHAWMPVVSNPLNRAQRRALRIEDVLANEQFIEPATRARLAALVKKHGVKS